MFFIAFSLIFPSAAIGNTSRESSIESTTANDSDYATIFESSGHTLVNIETINGKNARRYKSSSHAGAISLKSGSYNLKVYIWHTDHRFASVDTPITVENGHTYLLVPEYSDYTAGQSSVRLVLEDLGTDVKCKYVVSGSWLAKTVDFVCEKKGA